MKLIASETDFMNFWREVINYCAMILLFCAQNYLYDFFFKYYYYFRFQFSVISYYFCLNFIDFDLIRD